MKFDRIVAQVKYRSTYCCARCGTQELGDAGCASVEAESPHELHSKLQRVERSVPQPRDMPVGWASFWAQQGTEFRCRSCNTEVTQQ